MIDTILLDMDGVCCDFMGSALRLHGHCPDDVYARWPPGIWDVCQVLDMTPANFWAPINEQCGFWASLDPYPWFASLYCELRALVRDVVFCTSPSDCHSSYAGKRLWLAARGVRNDQIVMTSRKALLADPAHLLIDDSDHNVAGFYANGGHTITFPQLWNSLHDQADTGRARHVVRQVKSLMEAHA